MNSARDDPKGPGFPIRKSTDQRVLAPPRSLSQRATSFIASVRQGIHQMPLKRLIQRNPSRPGINPAFLKEKREQKLPRQRKLQNPERELIRLRYSSPCPKGKAGRLKTRQEVSQRLSNTPSRKAGRRKARKPSHHTNSDPHCQTTPRRSPAKASTRISRFPEMNASSQPDFRWPASPSPQSEGWWRRTGSNRRPEACKATALPTELRPQRVRPEAQSASAKGWWAREDLNFRPHAYQARALTN